MFAQEPEAPVEEALEGPLVDESATDEVAADESVEAGTPDVAELEALISDVRQAQVELTRATDAAGADDRLISRIDACLLYTSPSPRDQRGSRMPSSA